MIPPINWTDLSFRKILRGLISPVSIVLNCGEFFYRSELGFTGNSKILYQFAKIHWFSSVKCGHRFGELLYVCQTILSRWNSLGRKPGGVIVECGCWEGSSTAKLSIIANLIQWKLIVLFSSSNYASHFTSRLHG